MPLHHLRLSAPSPRSIFFFLRPRCSSWVRSGEFAALPNVFAISTASLASLFGMVEGRSLRTSQNFKILSSEKEYRTPRRSDVSIRKVGLGAIERGGSRRVAEVVPTHP
jgi:hypothetical protein